MTRVAIPFASTVYRDSLQHLHERLMETRGSVLIASRPRASAA